jgi:hypothetical protein
MLIYNTKFRHGIKYKFCYKCRKLVPGQLYLEHKVFRLNIIPIIIQFSLGLLRDWIKYRLWH